MTFASAEARLKSKAVILSQRRRAVEWNNRIPRLPERRQACNGDDLAVRLSQINSQVIRG